jgi:polyhydroxyalkanoate synthase
MTQDNKSAKTAETPLTDIQAKIPDPVEFGRKWAALTERYGKLTQDMAERSGGKTPNLDPLHISHAMMEMAQYWWLHPQKWFDHQAKLAQDYFSLFQYSSNKLRGEDSAPVAEPDKSDRRFKDAAWNESAAFDFLKQSYVMTTRWLQDVLTEGKSVLGDKDKLKIDFVMRQLSDAMSPTNFAMTNPEVLRATVESGGENLLKGLENLVTDLERGRGHLLIKMSDPNAFKLGENVGASKGQVVFRNEMIELIQYNPSTEKVAKTPLLVIPPWINKFYILDMREKNSLIKWAVDQGNTVFIISWRNGDEALKDADFAAYMKDGILAALEAIEKQTGETAVNAIGYCIGGTLLACTLAWLKAKDRAARIASATYFVTLVDFSEPGDMGVFIEEEQIAEIEAKMESNGGYLDAQSMHTTFNYLRPNDLIWSFVINNYLLGKEPFPFDLLYWNADSTCLPAAMHSYYLRNMYLNNLLIKPGALEMNGVKLDLRTIETPTFFLSTIEDHIAPWKPTYTATQIYSGPNEFVLSGSGHIAGVINPPDAAKYYYLTNPELPKNPDTWLKSAKRTEGSWWPYWEKWVSKYAGGQVPARDPLKGGLKALEPAPGSYVKVRSL